MTDDRGRSDAGESPWSELAAGAGANPAARRPPGSVSGSASGSASVAAEETLPWVPAAGRTADPDATRVMPVVPAAPPRTAPTEAPTSAPAGRSGGAAFHQRPATADPRIVVEPRRPALIGRFVVALAGLLAAGCLLLGIVLVIVQIAAPSLGGTGLEVATGPGWPAAAATLAVGVLGEVSFWLTVRSRRAVRITMSTVVVVAVLAVLAFVWWR